MSVNILCLVLCSLRQSLSVKPELADWLVLLASSLWGSRLHFPRLESQGFPHLPCICVGSGDFVQQQVVCPLDHLEK